MRTGRSVLPENWPPELPSRWTAEAAIAVPFLSHDKRREFGILPLCPNVVLNQALQVWRRKSHYAGEQDWVFASSRSKGARSRSAGAAGQDYLRPAAVKAGVITEDYRGRFGWHKLRHSLATYLAGRKPDCS